MHLELQHIISHHTILDSKMSTTNSLGINLSVVRSGLPSLTGLMNLLAIGGGLYGFVDPLVSTKGFGVAIPSSPSPIETALVKVHGMRNIGIGSSGLALLLYLQFSDLPRSSPAATTAVRNLIGITLLLVAIVGVGDSYILSELSQAQGLSKETVKLAKDNSTGHVYMASLFAALGIAWLFT